MRELYLGVDAGNSKTAALVADAGGHVLGRGRSGVGDIYGAETPEDAVVAVSSAVTAALASAGAQLSEVRHAAFRLAGADWAEDRTYLGAAIADALAGLDSWSLQNDGYALLRCGDLSGVGVAVTVGTGPAVASRGRGEPRSGGSAREGNEFSASWWIQDPLGGRDLGRAAFAAVVAAELGLGYATGLTDRLLDLYEVSDVEALLHTFTRRLGARPGRDHLRAARAVLQASAHGDDVALGIIRTQVRSLAGYARVAAQRVGLDGETQPFCVVIGGSIVASEHRAFGDALTEQLRRELPGADVVPAAGSPVAGALLDALAEGGVVVDERLREQVVLARHPQDFLLT